MPLQKGAVTFFRFNTETMTKKGLGDGLKKGGFKPLDLGKDEERTAGWVELEDPESTDFESGSYLFGEYLLIAYRVDTIRVPAPAVKAELKRYARSYQEQHGKKPSRAQEKEQKALITKKLKKRAFPNSKTYDVSWNLKTGEVLIWASSRKLVDEILIALEDGFDAHFDDVSPGALVEDDKKLLANLRPTEALFGEQVAHGI